MGTIDVIILIVIGVALVRGAFLGVIKQIGSFAGVLLGILLGNMFGDSVTHIMLSWFPSLMDVEYGDVIASVSSHILIFLIAYWGVIIVAKLFKTATKALALGMFDKILGSIFCCFKYLVLLSVALNIWMVLAPTGDAGLNAKLLDGGLYSFVYELAPWLLNSDIIPQSKELINSVVS